MIQRFNLIPYSEQRRAKWTTRIYSQKLLNVKNESFVDNGDYDFDDERFELVLERLETGRKSYVDSSCFTMEEIR